MKTIKYILVMIVIVGSGFEVAGETRGGKAGG